MCVLRPLRVVIDNYPENQVETVRVRQPSANPDMGTREILFPRCSISSAMILWKIRRKNIIALVREREVDSERLCHKI